MLIKDVLKRFMVCLFWHRENGKISRYDGYIGPDFRSNRGKRKAGFIDPYNQITCTTWERILVYWY